MHQELKGYYIDKMTDKKIGSTIKAIGDFFIAVAVLGLLFNGITDGRIKVIILIGVSSGLVANTIFLLRRFL